ncbi:hypothetical protein ACQKLN_04055 [Paenibacillus glucanolyticus]|uniref:hypothetical protein n=1 Tax=Paenibacillus TaxID=44249 RepID=UPI0036B6D33F|nr:hypothetical protein [Cytobacillus firmus]
MFKRFVSLIFICTLSVGIKHEPLFAAATPKLFSLNVELNKLQNAADFKLLAPSHTDQTYKLEIKEPYPFVPGKPVSKVRLHFFDESGQTYLFAIEEHNADGYKIEREVTSIDIRNRINTTRTIVENFKFSERGEKININGSEGRFEPWANHTAGGLLRWVQDSTFIEIDSKVFTKEEMVYLAKSMSTNGKR